MFLPLKNHNFTLLLRTTEFLRPDFITFSAFGQLISNLCLRVNFEIKGFFTCSQPWKWKIEWKYPSAGK